MKSLTQVYGKLRRKNLQNYLLLTVCSFLSVLLITAFSVMIQSKTVQTMLPEGGDSRKQMMMIFVLAIVGCGVFTTYASTLFFRSKSRELGIYMALGVKKQQLASLLYKDLLLIAGLSTAAGIILGTPLAMGIWQLFRLLVVNNSDMIFSIDLTGYLWPLLFTLFTIGMLLFSGWRFIRRSNILDVVNEQRKSEPIKEVKGWYGIAGTVLLLTGVILPSILPEILAAQGLTPPFWIKLLYLLAALGLYLLLVFVVVRGFGSKQHFYKQIITRSMMRFQGRQTVLNMCVIAALIIAGYFALFYIPMLTTSSLLSFANRPLDYAFHYQADETAIPQKAEIEQLAAEKNVEITDYQAFDFVNLATDGYDRDWTEDGRFGNEYAEFYAEASFLSASTFQAMTQMEVSVAAGEYLFVSSENYSHSPYDYIEEMTRFTNPDTGQVLETSFGDEIHYDLLHSYIVLADQDYAEITQGLSSTWQEKWIQFNVTDAKASYDFAKELKNQIIDRSSQASAIYENYDRIQRINVQEAGLAYEGDVQKDLQVSYDDRDSSHFNQYWRYIPTFRVLDQQNFLLNFAVYLMLFAFMFIICLATVIVIAYTRCLTIAIANQQVYEDLRKLGANRSYLAASIKNQVSKVFLIPIGIGTAVIFGFFTLLMYANTGSLDAGEQLALLVSAGLLAVISIVLWLIYRLTLSRVKKLLNV